MHTSCAAAHFVPSGQVMPVLHSVASGCPAHAASGVGEKRWLKIPPHLAYGSDSKGSIPPDSTLIFEAELMEIDSGPPMGGGAGGMGLGGQMPGGFPGGQFPGGAVPGQIPGR
jgi:hypothetical protein